MPSFALHPHPTTPCAFIQAVGVEVLRFPGGALHLHYRVEGDMQLLEIPARRPAARTDELWRHTCFEAFLRAPGASAYDEFNFSPSGAWAAYRFEHYRAGMIELELGQQPASTCKRQPRLLTLETAIGASDVAAQDLLLALSAVLRSKDGAVSYWALAHPPGKPDFHHETGFAAAL